MGLSEKALYMKGGVKMGEEKQAAALGALAGVAAGLAIGANLGKIVGALRRPGQWVRKTAGAAYGSVTKFLLQQKKALEDAMATAKEKGATQE